MKGVFEHQGARRALSFALPLAAAVALASALLPGAGAARAQTAPGSIGAPQVLGSAVAGNALTATSGRWSGSRPMTFGYAWLRCPASGGKPDGSDCVVIANATTNVYQAGAPDLGLRLRVRVTASNGSGVGSATSDATPRIGAAGRRAVSTTPPTISGTLAVGRTLTASPGLPAGVQPIRYRYQWQRCDGGGNACADIRGARHRTYTLRSLDAGGTLRVQVETRSAGGTTWASSVASGIVAVAPASPPKSTGEPRILGSAVEGSTLTATSGTWSGSTPLTFAYSWLRCPKTGSKADGSNCAAISDASKSAYQVRGADVGLRLRVRVTATNGEGSAGSTSNPTDVVRAAAQKPVSTSPPTISGTPVVGQTLTAGSGTWSGTRPLSFSAQWRRCDRTGGSCSDIGGARGQTYVLRSADVGNTLRVRLTATNSAGSASATSVPTGVVASAPRPPAGCPGGSGTVQAAQLSSPARLIVDQLDVSPRPISRSTGEVVTRFHVSACGGRSVQGALVYVTGVPFNQFSIPPEQPTGGDGWVTLTMQRLGSFPLTSKQGLLVMFVRARKPGESLLAGISTRRLVSARVDLSR